MDDNSSGHLINSLSSEQGTELLIAYYESFDENNLLSHEAVKAQHEKWLSEL
jgi:hypothetical protein